ncbi:hypothetical protein [Actinomycetospora termitidis]|uniref:Phytoene synthase n=1 Tax=Actinomycetospora termitidis TaxID=3053470 RepID=A0ABT7M9K2_9PSEU|nr:hypothetical protein [Actinomycetospora sp. Odt1-22]MDL5157358.1 hypothetical protein [Actinomycetospora sp. Odt1-22]
MAAVSDQYMISVLRPFVAATGPVLGGLREADPFRLGKLAQRRSLELEGPATEEPPARNRRQKVLRTARRLRGRALDRLATSRLPGTPRWAVMSPEERDHWWVGRVGRFTSAIAAFPGIGGALARRLPVSDILGLSAQGLVICAIAGEHGVTDRDEQVRLLAAVLFDRNLAPEGDAHGDQVERDAADLTGDLHREHSGDSRLRALARAVWRMGRSLFALHDELGRRPQGRWFWRTVANLPVVGAVGAYKSERSGLKRAARRAAAWVAREHG